MNSFNQIEDGAWCWFQDPRALRHVGACDKIYWGCVTKNGDIKISSYDCNNHKKDTFTLRPALDINDHAAPAILIRHDRRIVVFYSKHNANTMYWRISTNPEDITAFGDEMSFTGDGLQVCYPNPVQLPGEDNKIYLFYRKRTGESPTLERESYRASTDGENFGTEQDVIDVGNRTYVKAISNGIDKIHFCVTKSDDAAGIHKHVYYCYYYRGIHYKADGTKIGAALPLGESNLEKVYDSDAAGNYQAWVWDIELDSDGNPCIAFATFVSDADHRYNYARWTGNMWEVHEITNAGGCLYSGQPHYSGGIALDKKDPSIVYLSKLVSSQWEIQKFKTIDGGASWETPVNMTFDSPKKNIRPVAVRNRSSRFPVFWMYGDYTTYTDYETTISTKNTQEDDMYEIKPSKIRIDASSVCQLSCPSCPNTSKAMHTIVGSGLLKFKDFQKLIDENPWVKEIELSNYGEVFLNHELLEIIKYACKRDVALKADNGVNINNVQKDVLEGLVKYRFRTMTCSIDGASNETYKTYRVKGNFETVIENIRKINFFKQKYQSEYPILTWQFIVFGHNEHEIPLARKLAGELDMNFYLKLTWDDKFSPIRDQEYVRKLVGTASRAEYKQKYGIEYGQGFCHQLWDEPQINWDGKVLGCCRNFWGDFGGNAFRDGLLKSINSEKIKYARNMLLGIKIAREDIPCTTCSIYLHNKEEGKWLRRTQLSVSNSLSVKKESKRTEYEETIEFYKNLDISIAGIPKNEVPHQANVNMTDADLVAFYSEQYADVDVAEFLIKERRETLYGLCNLLKPEEFYLDVGCANAAHMEILHQRGIDGIGLDLSIPNILRGRQKYPHLKFIHGFVETIPFKDNYFDIVILGDAIEHFRNPKVGLAECLRVSRKGLALCIPIKPEMTTEHINQFSCDEILNLLEFYKLKVHFYDCEGRKISRAEAESKLEAFPWLLIRAEKTEQTNIAVKGIKDTEGVKEHRQAMDQILSNDEWPLNTEHQRDETHLNRFKLLSHLIEGQKVLEVGCGNGDLSVEMGKLGFDVLGVDISGPGIRQAIELAKKENLNTKAQFKVMDATSLEFSDNSFDTVLIPEVLEHGRDSRRLIEEAIRVVRNGGRIVISVPNGLLVPFQGHLRVYFKDTLTTELSQHTSEIRWHELPFKKWLVCSFFVRKNELNITEGPAVDILMPTYNGRKYIKNAIKSVLGQTYQNWNLVVVNDGGEDVKDILDEFQDNRIKYFVTEHKGKAHALNVGIANSDGKFVGYLDDDDILYPIHLEVLIKAASEGKKDFAYSDWYVVSLDEHDREIGREFEFRHDVIPWMLIRQNYISNNSFFHTRSLLEKAGMYDEELDVIIDWDMIRRLAFISKPYHVWGATSEGLHYYNKAVIENRITGLWARSPDKARRSMERITNKTMNLPAKTKELKKAVIDAMLYRSYYHSIEFTNALQAKDTQISNLEANLKENIFNIENLEAAITEKDGQISHLMGLAREREAEAEGLRAGLAEKDGEIGNLNEIVTQRDARVVHLEGVVSGREATLNHIYNSHGWKALLAYYKARDSVLPVGTRRRKFAVSIFKLFLIAPQITNKAERDGQIATLYHSTIWRITWPLRIVGDQLKRFRRVYGLAMPAIQRGGGLKSTLKEAIQLYRREGLADIRRRFIIVATSGQISPTLGPSEFDRNDYAEWIRRYDTLTDELRATMRDRIDNFVNKPLISVVMPTYNPKPEWLIEAIESIRKQIYPCWELCIADDASTDKRIRPILERYAREDTRIKVVFREKNSHICAASNSALVLVTGDWVALLDHDDLLAEHALFCVADAINQNSDTCLIYSDEDKIDSSGRRFDPYFKCDWNVDLFYSHNLISHLGVYRADLLKEIGGFREGLEGSQDYDLALRCVERIVPKQIHHIPRVLYHWRMHAESTAKSGDAKPYALRAGKIALNEHLQRQGVNAVADLLVFGMYRIRYALPDNLPLVSLIIPTRNNLHLIQRCIESILKKTNYPNYEILIVDNGSDDPETLQYFKELQFEPRVCVVRDDRPFNYSALNNIAVKIAHGELVGLINNDIEVISRDWLSEMVSHALRPGVGAVGARLWYPNNTLQHGGVVIGLGGVANHSHKHLPQKMLGYFGRANLIQNYSAITAACLVIRKSVYEEVGGFNEADLQVAFNDVDFCLRVGKAGYRNIWTPYAELYHHESATRGFEDSPEKQARFAREVQYMEQRFGDQLLNDPAYSPNLTLEHEDFSLAWPPRIEPLVSSWASYSTTPKTSICKKYE